jgi:hypothetical protein
VSWLRFFFKLFRFLGRWPSLVYQKLKKQVDSGCFDEFFWRLLSVDPSNFRFFEKNRKFIGILSFCQVYETSSNKPQTHHQILWLQLSKTKKLPKISTATPSTFSSMNCVGLAETIVQLLNENGIKIIDGAINDIRIYGLGIHSHSFPTLNSL